VAAHLLAAALVAPKIVAALVAEMPVLHAEHTAVLALVPAVWTLLAAQPVLPIQPPESGEPEAAEVAVQDNS